jgi:alpha-1,3-glucan synthase
MAQWPSYVQVNIFAFDNYFYGDVDGDGVIDRLPPNTVAPNYLNMSIPPQPVSYTPYFYLTDILCSI